MRTESVPTEKLAGMAWAGNPRRMSDHDMASLRRSMTTFGVVEPVVANRRTKRIVGGHQRVRAAAAEGIEMLPVVWVSLDEAGERQLNLALNRISGEWDEEALAAVLGDLQTAGADLGATGFESGELDRWLASLDDGHEETPVPAPPDDPRTRPGDLIQLGRHRLLCGDAGSREDLERLLGGETVHLVNSDPPYGVRVEPRSNNAIASGLKSTKGNVPKAKRGKRAKTHHQQLDLARHPSKAKPTGKMRAKDRALQNDFVSDEEFDRLLAAWFGNVAHALRPGGSFYLWGGYSNIKNYPRAIESAGLYFSQAIIWHKHWPVLTRKPFMGDHEWCYMGWKKGAPHYFSPEHNNIPDVWCVRKVAPPAMVHLTEKPVELAERALTYSSRRDETVLDLFGGSGSTLMAAERLGRRALLMEVDASYCDVIIERWRSATGGKVKGWGTKTRRGRTRGKA
jgi:DNA modification methylase